ncbi:hypothetical protein F5Y10DRAFT_272194 [Nemania abortiva]|nr:hypothetical protein F5Y10DRAFT_272194 [Nemania abortiva]
MAEGLITPHMRSIYTYWFAEWDKASVQVDALNSIIRVTSSVFAGLGEGGRVFFVRQASTLLNKPAEFILDKNNDRRIYLANRTDLEALIPYPLQQSVGFDLPQPLPPFYHERFGSAANYQIPGGFNTTQPPAVSNSNTYASHEASDARSSMGAHTPASNMNWNRSENLNINFNPAWAQNATPGTGIPHQQSQGQGSTQPFILPSSGANNSPPQDSFTTPLGKEPNMFPEYHRCGTARAQMTGEYQAVDNTAGPFSSDRLRSPNDPDPQGWAQEE